MNLLIYLLAVYLQLLGALEGYKLQLKVQS
jgi:hypothetical protein